METLEILRRAKATVPVLREFGTADLDRALLAMAEALETGTDGILEANAADMEAAKGSIGDVMLDRLRLTRERIGAMADGIRNVAALPSPPAGYWNGQFARTDWRSRRSPFRWAFWRSYTKAVRM